MHSGFAKQTSKNNGSKSKCGYSSGNINDKINNEQKYSYINDNNNDEDKSNSNNNIKMFQITITIMITNYD